MTALKMFVGNTSPPLNDTISLDGVAFNLTGSTVTFNMRLDSSPTLKVNAVAAVIVDAPSGMVQHIWAGTDTDTPGDYVFWWRVTLPSGKIQDSAEFPLVIEAHDSPTSLVTLEDIRDHVESGLNDKALGLLLNDAISEVETRFGNDLPQTIRVLADGRFIRLPRPALSIASIAELNELRYPIYTLQATDWELMPGGRLVERLAGGFTIYPDREWAPVVDLTFTPRPEAKIRARTIIALVKLANQYSGLMQENVGGRTGYIQYQQDYLKERERLLSAIPSARGFRFA